MTRKCWRTWTLDSQFDSGDFSREISIDDVWIDLLKIGLRSERRVEGMATLDWSQCPAVESVPGRVSGAWVLRGTRTPVKVLFENLESGMSIEEVIEQFPVTREQIDSLMAFVARSLEKDPAYA
jgi:uncharacterized protein (DUF433 family)